MPCLFVLWASTADLGAPFSGLRLCSAVLDAGPLLRFILPLGGPIEEWCLQVLLRLMACPDRAGLLAGFLSLVWAIWLVRNEARFHSMPFAQYTVAYYWVS